LNFSLSEKAKRYQEQLVAFMDAHVYPMEHEIELFHAKNIRALHPAIEELKAKAREQGLWNLFLPEEYGEYSGGLTNLEYAVLAEEMGKIMWASEIFNCSAPDTGNMEVFAKYGSDAQKEKYLKPLLDGKIRSAFLMTEPRVASSDARNIECSIVRDGDHYVVNGRKWWSTNVRHPNCSVYIVMGKTDPNASSFTQQSMVIVPADAEGVEIVRDLSAMGQHDYPSAHCEVQLTNVRVPLENIILGEGRGFEIAQGRLGPGRIHHAMRSIGAAQRAYDYLCKRVNERTAFGKPFHEMGSIREKTAGLFCEIQKCRLLTLKTADMVDKHGAKGAKDYIASIKISVIPMASKIIDECMQVFGGKGMSTDIPLAAMYSHWRAMRIADGPEEVHAYQLGRNLLKKARERKQSDIQYFVE